MTDAPWFPLYAKDWLMDTVELSHEQKGVHVDLLAIAWDREGLPIELDAVRKLARCSVGAWKRIWPALAAKWPELGGKRVNRWLEQQREATMVFAANKSRAGKAGAAKRWQCHPSAIDVPLANDSYSQSQSQPQSHNGSLSLAVGARVTPPPVELSPGQLQAAVPGLVGAWNNLCAVEGSPFQPVTVRSHPKATAALRAHPDIDWWAELFTRVGASDWLRRDARMAPVDFWWVLDHCEEIAVGRHDNRVALSKTGIALAEVLKDLA